MFSCKTPSFLLHHLRSNTLERGWVGVANVLQMRKRCTTSLKSQPGQNSQGSGPCSLYCTSLLPPRKQRARGIRVLHGWKGFFFVLIFSNVLYICKTAVDVCDSPVFAVFVTARSHFGNLLTWCDTWPFVTARFQFCQQLHSLIPETLLALGWTLSMFCDSLVSEFVS